MSATLGYKVTDENMQCRGFQFELNKVYTQSGEIKPCRNGFHYCLIAADCFGYYGFKPSNRVFEIVDHGTPVVDGNKSCTSSIEFLRELSWLEVLTLVNSGRDNTGLGNSGDRNSGDWNSGYRNSGDSNSGNRNSGNSNSGNRNSGNRNSGNWNSGDWNSGDRNSGDRNSGNWNSGYRNSGNWNSGDRNSGNSNSGNSNSGDWNSGYRNSGDSNSGYRNSGAFCTDNNPRVWLFDSPTDINVRDWERHEAYRTMAEYLNPNIWVYESEMTAEEKSANPHHSTTGGYLKLIPMQEAWGNMWGNLADKRKRVFLTLPNFNQEKFTTITGIKL